jgi:predicted aminopeptidase
VVWSVFATPELSLEPKRWCVPVVGCLSYLGYFRQERALALASRLRAEGHDTYVGGVPAYSTLGYFDDPILNTMLHWPEHRLAGLLFHELAHQVIYVRDDTTFNESFATAVELEGIRRWLEHNGTPSVRAAYREERARESDFVRLVLEARARLAEVYASGRDEAHKREAKARIFHELREAHFQIKHRDWGGYTGYDRWFAQDLNNAQLASVATYRELVPAFQTLLARHGGDLNAFYRAAEALGALPVGERTQALLALRGQDGPPSAQ